MLVRVGYKGNQVRAIGGQTRLQLHT